MQLKEALARLRARVFDGTASTTLLTQSRRLRARARAAGAADVVADTLVIDAILCGRQGRERRMLQLLRQARFESPTIIHYVALARTLHEGAVWTEAVVAYKELLELPVADDEVKEFARTNIRACAERKPFRPMTVPLPRGETDKIQTAIDSAYALSLIGKRAEALQLVREALMSSPRSESLRRMRDDLLALRPWLRP